MTLCKQNLLLGCEPQLRQEIPKELPVVTLTEMPPVPGCSPAGDEDGTPQRQERGAFPVYFYYQV